LKRWLSTLSAAGLAETAAHLLSLGWGFMVLMAGFVFVAVHVTANVASTHAKAVATEARVNALVPVIGTINTTANNAQTTANNALPISGGTITGSLNVNNNLAGSGGGTLEIPTSVHASNDGQFDGQMRSSSINVNGSGSGATVGINGGLHASGSGQFDSGISASNYSSGQGAPGGYPIAHGTPWENQIIDFLNSIVSKLQSAGVF